MGSSWEIAGKASWRLPGGSWEEGNVKIMCGSFYKILHQSCFFAPGSFREVPGRKAMSNLCVNPFKILHQSCFFAPGSFREAPGRKAMSKLCVNPCKIIY